ncbi:hypothetical protein HDV03_004421 [Kappamyces sp. JEL0829]|nr:hypothetical protein HDV03_004421 [Kappamyces sp. JEL0829]
MIPRKDQDQLFQQWKRGDIEVEKRRDVATELFSTSGKWDLVELLSCYRAAEWDIRVELKSLIQDTVLQSCFLEMLVDQHNVQQRIRLAKLEVQLPDLLELSAEQTREYVHKLCDEWLAVGDHAASRSCASLLLGQLTARGYLELVVEFCDPELYRVLLPDCTDEAASRLATAVIVKYSTRPFPSSEELASVYLALIGIRNWMEKKPLQTIINFDAIKNLAIHPMVVDALVLVFSAVDGRAGSSLVSSLLASLLAVWSSPVFIASASTSYQIRVAVGMLGCFRCLGASSAVSSEIKQRFLSAVPLYLEASRIQTTQLGMIVAETVSSVISPTVKLAFDLPQDHELAWIRKVVLQPVQSSWLPAAAPPLHAKEETKATPNALLKKDPPAALVHPMFSPKLKSSKTPHFLESALRLVRGDDASEILVGLKKLEDLVLKGSDTEIAENVEQLAQLVTLPDDYNLEEFETLLGNAMVALCIRAPTDCCRCDGDSDQRIFTKGLFERDVSILSKLRTIRVFSCIPLLLYENTSNDSLKLYLARNDTKSSSFYASLFANQILHLLSLQRNWTFVYDQQHNLRLGQRLLSALNLLVYMSSKLLVTHGPDHNSDAYKKLAQFLLSFRNSRLSRLYHREVVQGITVFLDGSSSLLLEERRAVEEFAHSIGVASEDEVLKRTIRNL